MLYTNCLYFLFLPVYVAATLLSVIVTLINRRSSGQSFFVAFLKIDEAILRISEFVVELELYLVASVAWVEN
jgi:hypothetical protein